jgi:hypothetical protein
MISNNDFEEAWKKAAMDYMKVLSRNLLRGTEEIHIRCFTGHFPIQNWRAIYAVKIDHKIHLKKYVI